MKIEDMHHTIDDKLNKLNVQRYDAILPDQKDMFINEAIDEFISKAVNSLKNMTREGFQESQNRLDDLRTLHVSKVDSQIEPIMIYPNFSEFEIPEDYLHLIDLSARLTYDCKGISTNSTSTEIIPRIGKIEIPDHFDFFADQNQIGYSKEGTAIIKQDLVDNLIHMHHISIGLPSNNKIKIKNVALRFLQTSVGGKYYYKVLSNLYPFIKEEKVNKEPHNTITIDLGNQIKKDVTLDSYSIDNIPKLVRFWRPGHATSVLGRSGESNNDSYFIISKSGAGNQDFRHYDNNGNLTDTAKGDLFNLHLTKGSVDGSFEPNDSNNATGYVLLSETPSSVYNVKNINRLRQDGLIVTKQIQSDQSSEEYIDLSGNGSPLYFYEEITPQAIELNFDEATVEYANYVSQYVPSNPDYTIELTSPHSAIMSHPEATNIFTDIKSIFIDSWLTSTNVTLSNPYLLLTNPLNEPASLKRRLYTGSALSQIGGNITTQIPVNYLIAIGEEKLLDEDQGGNTSQVISKDDFFKKIANNSPVIYWENYKDKVYPNTLIVEIEQGENVYIANNNYYKNVTFDLPPLTEVVTNVKGNTKITDARLIQSNVIPQYQRSKYKRSSLSSPIAELFSDRIRLYNGKDFIATQIYQLEYLRKPKSVKHPDSDGPGKQDCELPDHTHRKIINIAVNNITAALQPNKYQVTANEEKLN